MRSGILTFVVLVTLGLSSSPSPAYAREFMVGTLAYSYAAGHHPNIFIQGAITDRSAWFLDKCNDDGNTVAGLYKSYWRKFSDGPYWFGGLVYIEKGTRAGTSLAAGVGYEILTRNNISLGTYAGYAGGGSGQQFGVFDITLAYVFH